MRKPVRQGDVLLLPIQALPIDAKKVNIQTEIILAYGEKTGHRHALDTKYASMYEWQGNRLIVATKGATLIHGHDLKGTGGDHGPITLKPGIYKVIQQRFHTPEAVRNVED